MFFHSNLQLTLLNSWVKEKPPVLSPTFQGILALWFVLPGFTLSHCQRTFSAFPVSVFFTKEIPQHRPLTFNTSLWLREM